MSPPTLSIVVPAFSEEANLPALFRAVTEVLDTAGETFELVMVDDGSRDRTWEMIREASARDARIRGLSLSRNFGHQVAISAGIKHARGAAVAVLALLSEIPIPLDSGDFCLMDRRVVDMLNALPERRRFVRGLRAWVGLKQVGLEYDRDARHAGAPKYTFRALMHLASDGLVSFSIRPLRLATRLGFVMSALAMLVSLAYLLLRMLGVGTWPDGFASLFVGMFFLFGVQFVLIGILGEYVGRIHLEVKGRPLYLLGDTVGVEPGDEAASR